MKLRQFATAVALALILTLAPALANAEGNTRIQSFNKAKKLMLKKVYYDHRTTIYCGCTFSSKKKITRRNGYVPIRDNKRANRLEWEHVVPAHAFGQSFKEWRKGHPSCVSRKGKRFKGRKCTEKVNHTFRYMQADMYNLYPAVGEINGLRSNFSFAMIPGEARRFGKCDMEIEGRKAEPPAHVRGDIARTYFYMNWAYPGRGIISKKNKKLFEAWAKQDPIDDWERERARRIKAIQGNENPFIQ
jgi:deoxyribonuclease-1